MSPHPNLEPFIECYWMMYSEDPAPKVEKIIPDGFTELIFNYGSVYKACMKGDWQLQSPNLLAGQITGYFYLENTGPTGSFAVKLKPAALTQLFNLKMDEYVDKIVDLDTLPHSGLVQLKEVLLPFQDEQQVKQQLDEHFMLLSKNAAENPVKEALELIFQTNGMATVAELSGVAGVGERQLERLFRRYIGLSPKYYSRIIKFNYIFQLMKAGNNSWADIVFESGYYDQSHFIRNFKSFTGEDPTGYFFDENNMANFFLKK